MASRRSLLIAAVGLTAVLATGCDLVEAARIEAGQDAASEPDRVLLEAITAEAAGLAALVAATASQIPRLAPNLDGLRLLHEDHLRVLREIAGAQPGVGHPAPSAPPAPPVPAGAGRALAHLRTAESAHLEAALAGAHTADRGELARVLACMGAGLTQHLVVLPTLLAQVAQ